MIVLPPLTPLKITWRNSLIFFLLLWIYLMPFQFFFFTKKNRVPSFPFQKIVHQALYPLFTLFTSLTYLAADGPFNAFIYCFWHFILPHLHTHTDIFYNYSKSPFIGGQSIALTNCKINEIRKDRRDLCTRMHAFELLLSKGILAYTKS